MFVLQYFVSNFGLFVICFSDASTLFLRHFPLLEHICFYVKVQVDLIS